MGQPGQFKPGSLSARMLAAIEGSEAPVPRSALVALTSRADRAYLNRVLDRLVVRGLVRETARGFVAEGRAAARPADARPEPAPEPLPERLRLHLAAILRRAHALCGSGRRASAVLLLASAARHPALPAHVGSDLAALAALFRHHEPLGRAA